MARLQKVFTGTTETAPDLENLFIYSIKIFKKNFLFTIILKLYLKNFNKNSERQWSF